MQTTVKELPGSRVEVEVEVPSGDVEKGVNRAARSLAREMRLPGFRKGKAPPSLVIQRLGFGPVLEEAIRDSLPDWYERALLASKVISVGDPSVEIVSTPEGEGEPLGFKFEIGVRPEAKLGEYKGLEVGRAEHRGARRTSSTARSSGSARASPSSSRSSAPPRPATPC